jgi:hypothetical protein
VPALGSPTDSNEASDTPLSLNLLLSSSEEDSAAAPSLRLGSELCGCPRSDVSDAHAEAPLEPPAEAPAEP